jgi:hypothetical protein
MEGRDIAFTFAIDANIPIGLNNPRINFLDAFVIIRDIGHEIVMSSVNHRETVKGTNISLYQWLDGRVNALDIPDDVYSDVRKECLTDRSGKTMVQAERPDYYLIAAAKESNADFAVTDDKKVKYISNEYKYNIGLPKGKMTAIGTAELLYIAFEGGGEDRLDWKKHVHLTLDHYSVNEIPRIYDGVKRRRWKEGWLVDAFDPYKEGVYKNINGR